MIKRFLLALADKPTPQIPDTWLRALDAYFRRGRHTDKVGLISGRALILRLREERVRAAFAH